MILKRMEKVVPCNGRRNNKKQSCSWEGNSQKKSAKGRNSRKKNNQPVCGGEKKLMCKQVGAMCSHAHMLIIAFLSPHANI